MHNHIAKQCDKKFDSGAKGIGHVTDSTMKKLYGLNPAAKRRK